MIETNEEKNIDFLINDLGVFELRAVARQLGIPSPTTKKRDELISLIQDSIKQGSKIKDSSQKRGRPFKKLNILDSLTEKINNEVIKQDFSNTRRIIDFSQDDAEFLKFNELEGIVSKLNYSIEMRDLKTNQLVKFENKPEIDQLLHVGDKVRVTVKTVDEKCFADRILTINDEKYEDYRPNFVETGSSIISNEVIPFAGAQSIIGRRNLYKLDRDLFETNYLFELNNYCKKENYRLILLANNTSYENEIVFNALPIEDKFVTVYGTNGETNYHKILDTVNYAENLLNKGNKVVVFVADIMETVRSLEKYFALKSKQEETLEEATLSISSELLRFARAYENGFNGTLIMCYNESDKFDKFLTNDIFKISNKIN